MGYDDGNHREDMSRYNEQGILLKLATGLRNQPGVWVGTFDMVPFCPRLILYLTCYLVDSQTHAIYINPVVLLGYVEPVSCKLRFCFSDYSAYGCIHISNC
jgi:hypothetical protein